MTNLEKYKNAFAEGLGVSIDQVEGLEYQGIAEWDSVGHMTLIDAIERALDITMDTDDILEFSSFAKGKEILEINYNVKFH